MVGSRGRGTAVLREGERAFVKKKRNARSTQSSGATVGYESRLWEMADALHNNMDAAEYEHVVLGLIFLEYISDAFEAKHAELVGQKTKGADPEDPDEYRASRELVATVRNNATIDWTIRENVRAQLRVHVKRILRRYGYPPDKQEKAAQTVLEQAEVLSAAWAA